MNKISPFLPSSVPFIQKSLPFHLSTIDKMILVVAATIFAAIAVIYFVRTWNDPIEADRIERSQKELDTAIAQLKTDPPSHRESTLKIY